MDKITPKALANSSPRLERSDNLGNFAPRISMNPERVRFVANLFRVDSIRVVPRVVAALQLWAEISERLRRIECAVQSPLTHRNDCGSIISAMINFAWAGVRP